MSLYSNVFYSPEITDLLSETSMIAHMLRVESALAEAQSMNGIIDQPSAEIISQLCQVEKIDLLRLKKEIPLGGNAAIPLVKQLTELVHSENPQAAKFVHYGATSQDIIDTATILQIKVYIEWLEIQIKRLIHRLIDLTIKHRETIMIGRTLMQQAKPITFGLKTAGWLESIANSRERISQAKPRILKVQLGGAVGSGGPFISQEVVQEFAKILSLQPATPWHTHRDHIAEFGTTLAILSGSLGKIAKDISLLMQTEVGEVFEGK
ncbi:MAG: 3-carboxy-cis,cis-muconate cycloisomerase, partial [Bacteroidetes bacterium]|nr:3-carboxy-cis,cis-muconate cycloisomerase [Bacteroidota bacterium]